MASDRWDVSDRLGLDVQSSLAIHRVPRVESEVHQGRLKLDNIRFGEAKRVPRAVLNLYQAAESRTQEVEGLRHMRHDVEHLRFEGLPARKGEKLARQSGQGDAWRVHDLSGRMGGITTEVLMSHKMLPVLVAAGFLFSALSAFAQGHIAGGVVGAAVAPKHHRVAGAVVGGAVGHHMAKTKAKKQAAAVTKP